MSRRVLWSLFLTVGVAIAGLMFLNAGPVKASAVTVYKDPYCGCCDAWVDHLRASGFSVRVRERTDMAAVKAQIGIPTNLQSCHTATISEYVIEGHVPAADIARLLDERPEARGLAVPGMPIGSPGMEGPNPRPYASLLFSGSGEAAVFARH